jgi:hypothetical protein
MPKTLVRKDFLLKELTVSIGGGAGSAYLPADDGQLPPPPISPIASVVGSLDLIEAVRAIVVDAVREKKFGDIGRAFVATEEGGSPAIRGAIQEIGTRVVASVAYAALGRAGMPDPDCGGTSLETIPPTLTPVVHIGREVHQVTALPQLQRQLAETVAYVDKAAAAQAPHGAEIGVVRAHLEGALKSLPQEESAKA